MQSSGEPVDAGIFPNESGGRKVSPGSMKTYRKPTILAVLAVASALSSLTVRADPAADESMTAPPPDAAVEEDSAAAASAKKRHLALCAMLGLKVGGTYEFMIAGNEEVHYWKIPSLGNHGWILARDSRHAATWVNLSRVIAVTPVNMRMSATERPLKPNRAR